MLALLSAMALAGASVLPAAAGDPHLQQVRYEPNSVVALVGHLGFQTMIQFGANERIENVAIGDASAWQVMPNKRADLLFVKPTGRAAATNMVVVTNERTYSFALSVAPAKASTAAAVWTLRFVVPAPIRAAPPPTPAAPVVTNRSYTVTGPEALLPTDVFDDGRSTYFRWPEEAAFPAIFSVNPDGTEALVDFTVRDGEVAVQQTAGRFVLRRGETWATVTSTPGTTRRLPSAPGRTKP